MNFTEQFRAAHAVSTPLVAIRTFDAKSTVTAVRSALNGKLTKAPLLLWDVVHGLQALTPSAQEELAAILAGAGGADEISQVATTAPTEALRAIERCTSDTIVFMANAHLQWAGPTPDPGVIQGIWNLRDGFKARGNMLVLLCAPGAVLPAELVNDVLVLEEPLPTTAQLEAIIAGTYKSAKLDAPSAEVLAKATDALIGLPAFPADQATAMCLNITDGTLSIEDMWQRKRDIISQAPGLSVWQGPERMEDIGGLDAVKAFCTAIVQGIEPPKTIIFIDEIEKAFAGTGTDTSGVKTELTGSMLSWMQDTEMDGLIFIGLPGVSKSALAKGLGGTHGIPVINFDLAGMQSSLVGSSGANLRAAQKTVDAISGGRVLAIATCNSIGALPPELRRRFGEGIFFFDAPTAEERKAIWAIYRGKYAIPEDDPGPHDEGWTGAEIKQCCKIAYRRRMSLVQAAQYIVPVTKASADQVKELRMSCSGKFLSASKPGVYRFTETAIEVPAMPVYFDEGRKLREMN